MTGTAIEMKERAEPIVLAVKAGSGEIEQRLAITW
jgi:hypothetical protein